jgi:lysozyme family protein
VNTTKSALPIFKKHMVSKAHTETSTVKCNKNTDYTQFKQKSFENEVQNLKLTIQKLEKELEAKNIQLATKDLQLNKALDSEIKYENENYSQLEDIETYLNESGF